MNHPDNTIAVNVVVEMTPEALQAIVENAKRLSGRNEKGHYKVDTADMVGETITRFLAERNFEEFAVDPANYHTG